MEDSSKTDPHFLMCDEEQDRGNKKLAGRRNLMSVPAPVVAGSSIGACWLQLFSSSVAGASSRGSRLIRLQRIYNF